MKRIPANETQSGRRGQAPLRHRLDYLLCALLLFCATLIFSWLAARYAGLFATESASPPETGNKANPSVF